MAALIGSLLFSANTLGPRAAPGAGVRYLQYDEVKDLLASYAALPVSQEEVEGRPADAPLEIRDAASWDDWVRRRDEEIRGRIARGEEDSISNLVLYGTRTTNLPRLDGPEAAFTPAGELTQLATGRIDALVAALERPETDERIAFVRDFLTERGVLRNGSEAEVKQVLASNLRRFAGEQRGYQQKLEQAARSGDVGRVLSTRETLFDSRGLSVDTSLLPNLAIEEALRALVDKGVLARGGIRRIAVIGPGLDFADKRDGYDFYPLQTIQPFAVLEAVEKLGLGRAARVDVVAFDLNPVVLAHLRRLARGAREGRGYVIQLPRDPSAGWNKMAAGYWERFGSLLGAPSVPLPAPRSLLGKAGEEGGLAIRAVRIRPEYASRIRCVDLDTVTQTLDVPPGQGFDLVVATNVLVYYGRFEQSLAMLSASTMMNAHGVFLANHVLPLQHAPNLRYLGRRSLSYSLDGAYGDDVVVYLRE